MCTLLNVFQNYVSKNLISLGGREIGCIQNTKNNGKWVGHVGNQIQSRIIWELIKPVFMKLYSEYFDFDDSNILIGAIEEMLSTKCNPSLQQSSAILRMTKEFHPPKAVKIQENCEVQLALHNWDEILNTMVEPTIFTEFSIEEILSCFIFEMTLNGYNKQDVCSKIIWRKSQSPEYMTAKLAFEKLTRGSVWMTL